MQKKVLSLILVLCLLFGMLPHSLAAPAAAAERSPLVLQVVKEGVDENDDGGLLQTWGRFLCLGKSLKTQQKGTVS